MSEKLKSKSDYIKCRLYPKRGTGSGFLLFVFMIYYIICLLPQFIFAQIDSGNNQQSNTPLVEVSLNYDGRINIPIIVNDSDTLSTILESGITNNVLLMTHREIGEKLKLKYLKRIPISGGLGSGPSKMVNLTQVELKLNNFNMGAAVGGVIDESRDSSLFHNEAVLGAGAWLFKYIVKVDFDSLKVSFFDPDSFRIEKDWEEIPITLQNKFAVIETSITFNESKEIPVKLIIDTGGGKDMLLILDTKKGIKLPEQNVYSLVGVGLRGETYSNMARLQGVKFGNYNLKNIIPAFFKKEDMPDAISGISDGVISMGILYRFNTIFDYAHSRIFIKPNKYFNDPFEINMAGISIVTKGNNERVVFHVLGNSEAYSKGIRKGDIIEKVNNQNVSDITEDELKKLFEKVGNTLDIILKRGQKMIETRIKLKRYL